jgi:hypothetical protein
LINLYHVISSRRYRHIYIYIYIYIHIISKLSTQEINYYFLYNFYTVHAYATVETKKLKIKRNTNRIWHVFFLYTKLVLLSCVCYYDFKYLYDEYIRNTNIIWQHKLFFTNRNINGPGKYKQIHRQIKTVGIFHRALEFFTSQLHYSLCSMHTRSSMKNVYRCFPENYKVLFTSHLFCLLLFSTYKIIDD